MSDDVISFDDFWKAIVLLEQWDRSGPHMIKPPPDRLAALRSIFTDDEIQEIFLGEGAGWDRYLEMAREDNGS